jgi:hypothetical protein
MSAIVFPFSPIRAPIPVKSKLLTSLFAIASAIAVLAFSLSATGPW